VFMAVAPEVACLPVVALNTLLMAQDLLSERQPGPANRFPYDPSLIRRADVQHLGCHAPRFRFGDSPAAARRHE
jgi:hypothetical protein